MNKSIKKPKSSNYSAFEDIYLKSSYLKNIKNDDANFMNMYSMFSESIQKIGKRFFVKNNAIFSATGFEYKDIDSFCNVQAWSYIELFSITVNPEALQKFIAKRKIDYPERTFLTNSDIYRKDRSNFMSFLSQRLSELVRVCKIKSRNIRGIREIQGFFLKTENAVSVSLDLLQQNPEEYGYEKLTEKELLDLKKKMGSLFSYKNLSFEGSEYIYINYVPAVDESSIKNMLYSPHDSLFYMNPEEIAIKEEEYLSDLNAKAQRKIYSMAPALLKIKILNKKKQTLTKKDNQIRLMIDQKIMELRGEQKRVNP